MRAPQAASRVRSFSSGPSCKAPFLFGRLGWNRSFSFEGRCEFPLLGSSPFWAPQAVIFSRGRARLLPDGSHPFQWRTRRGNRLLSPPQDMSDAQRCTPNVKMPSLPRTVFFVGDVRFFVFSLLSDFRLITSFGGKVQAVWSLFGSGKPELLFPVLRPDFPPSCSPTFADSRLSIYCPGFALP